MMPIIILFFASLLATALAESDMAANIYGGEDAVEDSIPYQVCLAKNNRFICSGALISPTFVLSAAHCFDKRDRARIYSVYLGSIKNMRGLKRTGLSFIIHPEYDRRPGLVNDIALLEIPEVPYSDNIQNVDLPDISKSDSDYVNAAAITSGWGLINNKKEVASILQYTKLEVFNNSVCAQDPVLGNRVTETNICAGDYGGSTPCKGDSGGPLVAMDSGVLIGLTSFGSSAFNCADQISTVFTSICSYRQWILDNSGV